MFNKCWPSFIGSNTFSIGVILRLKTKAAISTRDMHIDQRSLNQCICWTMHSFLHCIFVTGEKIDTFMYNPTNICWKPCHSLHKEYIINSNKYRKRDHHFVIIRFTDFYNSQCIMHFTATFIRIRTNISIIENIMFVQVST